MRGAGTITDRVYKTVEITGTSPEGIDVAISNAITKASASLRHIDWFEVTQIRGHVDGGSRIGHYQVTMKVGFRLED